MTDPISVPTAVFAGASGAAVAASMLDPETLALAAFGVNSQAVSMGLIGAVLGLSFTPPAKPIHGAARFVASALFSAVVGTAAGQQWSLSKFATNAAICTTGALLHLGLSWVGKRFGQIADAGARRVGIDIDVGDK